MWTDAGCFGLLFLALASVVAALALRSAWKLRHEPPLTTLRLIVLLSLIVGGCLVPVALRMVTPDMLLAMAAGVFIVSVGWLSVRGL